jgi:hypothetical protein
MTLTQGTAAGPSLFAKGVERLFLQEEEAEKSRVDR